jgi:hypothetical protein
MSESSHVGCGVVWPVTLPRCSWLEAVVRRPAWLQHSGLLGTCFGRICEQFETSPRVITVANSRPRCVAVAFAVETQSPALHFLHGLASVVGGRDSAMLLLRCIADFVARFVSAVSSSLRDVFVGSASPSSRFIYMRTRVYSSDAG